MSLFPLEERRAVELIKHTAAIHIKTNLSLVDRKVLNILLKNAYDEIDTAKYHTIRLAEIKNLIGWEGKNYVKLKASLRKLVDTKIEWNIFEKDKKNQWCISSLLASASIAGGKCTYDYSYHLKALFKNPNIYGKINLLTQNNFRSKYSLILWEFLMNHASNEKGITSGTEWVKLKNYRDLMGIEDGKYSSFKELNYNLINTPIKDINKVSDMDVEVKYQKVGTSVVAVRFIITKKTDEKEAEKTEIKALPEKDTSSIKDKLLNYCKLSAVSVDNILKNYSTEQLIANVEYIEAANKKGLIKSISSYSFNAIKNDFRLDVTAKEPEKKEETKEIRVLRENLKKAFLHHQLDYDIYLNGNDIKKTKDGYLMSVSASGQRIVKTKYIKILESLNIHLEVVG